jgi:hypothetical protein
MDQEVTHNDDVGALNKGIGVNILGGVSLQTSRDRESLESLASGTFVSIGFQ